MKREHCIYHPLLAHRVTVPPQQRRHVLVLVKQCAELAEANFGCRRTLDKAQRQCVEFTGSQRPCGSAQQKSEEIKRKLLIQYILITTDETISATHLESASLNAL